MIHIIDNISNYLVYLFIIYYGFRISPRKNRLYLGGSVLIMLSAGAFNAYFDTNSPIVYILWSVLAVCLFFEDHIGHLLLLSAALMYFTGIVDTFSVILIQVVLIGGGVPGSDIAWSMEPAYLLSFLVYLLVYLFLLFDLTTLMGNILQNAIEATVKASNPKIMVELLEHKKEFFIVVGNSTAEIIDTKKDFSMTSKKDKANHGFGLKNIAGIKMFLHKSVRIVVEESL